MRQLKLALIFIGFWTVAFAGHTLDLTKINLSYQYDVGDELTFRSRVTQRGKEVQVYYQVHADSISRWQQELLVQTGYSSGRHDTDTLTAYTIDTLSSSPGSLMLRLTLEPAENDLLVISWRSLSRGTYRFYDVQIKSPVGFPSFLPVDEFGLPVMERFVREEGLTLEGDRSKYHVFRYLDDFEAADPAMGMMKAIAPTLRIDSSFYCSGELMDLKLYHFYLIQEDTFSENGLTILCTPSYYPKHRRLEELVGPLTYITTANEKKMLNEQMTKKAFENFWLNTYNTKLRAKTAIKRFYDQVELANRLFTSYKQGWKTDRGMLYIVFGKPDEVIRTHRTEVWKYREGPEFEFIRISTLFTPSLYSLKRNRKYEQTWYDQVGNIRKGL